MLLDFRLRAFTKHCARTIVTNTGLKSGICDRDDQSKHMENP
ncbi:MAG: hypothetical protein ACI92Z_003456, partial [Paracoccaceae bacterium]